MKIPVFVSCPTSLNNAQQAWRRAIDTQLDMFGLEPRALGRSDYPVVNPLREVLLVARHCAGGLVLGFNQLCAESGVRRPGTEREVSAGPINLPTEWNHIEAGILFALGLPLLVFCEEGVKGGVFDLGTGDFFIHGMPTSSSPEDRLDSLQAVFLRWQAKVHEHYYQP